MDFLDVKIDRNEIDNSLLNIETRSRKSLFAWNGQFSPQFVETILKKYATESLHCFDPFAGSGTVLVEAARLSIPVLGIELNPSAYHMTKCYEFCNVSLEKRIDYLDLLKKEIDFSDENNVLKRLIELSTADDAALSCLASALVVLLDVFNNELDKTLVNKKYEKLRNIIINLPHTSSQVRAVLGDIRTSIPSNSSFDFILTSPPYINVFNYHQNYRRSTELLGYKILEIAKKEFGSNRRNRSNRLLTVIEYSIDMALAINEILKHMTNQGRIIFVVGRESKVLGYSFCNSSIIYDIFTKIFGCACLLRQERHFKNRFGQIIYEDIIHFHKGECFERQQENIIIDKAKTIAVNSLKKHLFENNDNKSKLVEAIEKACLVTKSEEEL